GSLWIAVGLNWLAAGGALAAWRISSDGVVVEPACAAPPPGHPGQGRTWALASIFLSGFTAMVYEVVWTRLASLLVGSSTYAFTTVLAVFLLGISLGSLGVASWAQRTRHPALLLAFIQGGTALFVWASCPLLDQGHALTLYTSLYAGNPFWNLLLAEFLLAMAVMLIPTLLLGATFPAACRLDLDRGASAPRSAGILYGSNTLGAILGVLAGGFLFLGNPNIGAQKALIIGGAINAGVAVALASAVLWPRRRTVAFLWLIAVMTVILVYWHLPRWHQTLLACGAYDQLDHIKNQVRRRNIEAVLRNQPLAPLNLVSLREVIEREKLLFYAEGPDATVTVTGRRAENGETLKFLRINGKCEATSGFRHDLPTQVLVAQVGLCTHPQPHRVGVIGLASGITLGSVLTHPEVTRADCLELSPSVVGAARLFAEENGGALDDPRARLILNDGRNHFLATDSVYDLIISEPSNPWVTGASNLFTLEHFRNCRQRLAPGGRMCQWLQLYGMTPELLRTLIRTFLEVFPHTTLWIYRHDLILVGAGDSWTPDTRVMENHLTEPGVRADLARIEIRSVAHFRGYARLDEEALRTLAGNGPLNTDDHPVIEFR
ncbi:MAG: fused MFS/spermidine synthase, partial [Chloroflexota bacterium]